MRVSREHIRKREGERRQAGASTADTDATRVLFFLRIILVKLRRSPEVTLISLTCLMF